MDTELLKEQLETKKITGIVLKNGTYIQICTQHVNIYTDGMACRAYVSNPDPTVKIDIWGEDYICIGMDSVRIHPNDVRVIDFEDKED